MAMDKSAADSYVYARASGILAKSFIGNRARDLFSYHSLQELWSALFKKEIPSVPESMLARALEKEAFDTFVEQYKGLLKNYAKPSPVLLSLMHGYDYENLKDIGSALALEEKELPSIHSIKPFNIIDYDKWPDLKAITADSPLSWYDKPVSIKEQKSVNYKIDCQNIIELWKALNTTEISCRSAVRKLFAEKLQIDNIVWAIRLRLYYNMSREDIIPLLMYSTAQKKENDILAKDAIMSLDWPLNDYGCWKKWKHSELLNFHDDGSVWSVDPRWISNAYKPVYVEKAHRMFHMYPFTCCPMVCWFILKQNELDNIRTASESLRLNVGAQEAMKIMGIQE